MNTRSSSPLGRAVAAATVFALAVAIFPAVASAQTVTVKVGGQPMYLSPGPIERAGRVFVPLRGIFERLGSTVVYQAGTINATKGRTTVSLRIGSTQAIVDGQQQLLDVAPFIVGATTYVPLRFVAQSFGATVGYDANTRVVAIRPSGGGGGNYPPPAPYPPPRPNPPPYPPPGNPVQLRAQQPGPGASTSDRFVTISAEYTRQVRAGTVRVRLDGNDVTSRCNLSSYSFSYKPPAPLYVGTHTVRVSGADVNNLSFERTWSFYTTNGNPPPSALELRAQKPAPGTSLADRFTVISAQFTREVQTGSVTVRLDGNDISSRSGLSATGFSYKPPAPLDFGLHTVRVTGRGAGGVAFDRSWSFTVIRSLPPVPSLHLTIDQPAPNAPVSRSFVVGGNTIANGQISVTAGPTPKSNGQFSGSTTAGPRGNFKLTVDLTSPLMGQQAITVKIVATDPVSGRTVQKVLQLRLSQ
ncbi:MAG TPA: copper amine oxidase N-terminal domain-containing protein [Candidatus Tumulicola sp.]